MRLERFSRALPVERAHPGSPQALTNLSAYDGLADRDGNCLSKLPNDCRWARSARLMSGVGCRPTGLRNRRRLAQNHGLGNYSGVRISPLRFLLQTIHMLAQQEYDDADHDRSKPPRMTASGSMIRGASCPSRKAPKP